MNKYHFPDPIRGKRSKRNYSFVFKRDDDICQYCGDIATTIDHIIPWNFKNDNSSENMVASCKRCNSLAGDKLFRDFNDKKLYILNRRIQKELGIKNPLQWPNIKFEPIPSVRKLVRREKLQAKICKQCGKEFTPKVGWQKFCSTKHREEYWQLIYNTPYNLSERIQELEEKTGISK